MTPALWHEARQRQSNFIPMQSPYRNVDVRNRFNNARPNILPVFYNSGFPFFSFLCQGELAGRPLALDFSRGAAYPHGP
jgi:hypothetical protein